MISTCLQGLATFIGFIGTLVMFFNSHSLLPYQTAMCAGDEIDKEIKRKNKNMLRMQKLGMGLLTLSFFLQLLSYIF